MKKIILLIPIILIITFIISGFLFLNNESGNPSKFLANKPSIEKVSDIILSREQVEKFDKIKLFSFYNEGFQKYGLNSTVSKASVLKINSDKLSEILNTQPENLILEIPLSKDKNMQVELYKTELFSPDFKIRAITASGIQIVNIFPGIHYRGIVKGDINSVVAFSFYKDRIMGILSDDNGNYNIGLVNRNGNTDDYMFFNESDLSKKNPFECKVDDYNPKFRKISKNNSNGIVDNTTRLSVKAYYVADYRTFLSFGSNITNVSNYITGAFNSVALLYQNEYLPLLISQIDVYQSTDPYVNLHDPYSILTAFGGTIQNNFTGDLAQLLTTRQENFGGIAWINTLCQNFNPADSSGRYSFCGIDTTYLSYPTYSWTITVMAHEMGHNFGSMHTQACWWPITTSIIGSIDSCYTAEGNCFSQTQPNYNGTLMSYCHLNGAIKLRNGFGPMPGDTVRLRYNQAICFGGTINSSEAPTVFSLRQNYPNPFNPGTSIQFDVPNDAIISLKAYDINGREIAKLLNSSYYVQGTYSVYFNTFNYSLASGIYFYKIVAVDVSSPSKLLFTEVKKMVYIK